MISYLYEYESNWDYIYKKIVRSYFITIWFLINSMFFNINKKHDLICMYFIVYQYFEVVDGYRTYFKWIDSLIIIVSDIYILIFNKNYYYKWVVSYIILEILYFKKNELWIWASKKVMHKNNC